MTAIEQPLHTTHAAAAILVRDGKLLIARRPPHKKIMPDYWEFPGGKVEAGETPEHTVARELEEEIGVTVPALEPWRFLSETRHAHGDEPPYHVIVYLYLVRRWTGEPAGAEGQEVRWVEPQELDQVKLLPANVPLIPSLQEIV